MAADAVLVTGASGGLGGAVALALAAGGRAVALHGHRHPERARALAGTIHDGGGRAEAFTADLATVAGCAELARAARTWASLGGLVHAAGLTRDALLPRLSEADWDGVVAVHLSAAWRLVRATGIAPGGFVVLVGSGAGLHGRAGQAPYAAAKAGLVGLTEALARALGPDGVRVNAVLPGPLDTPMWRALGDRQRKAVLRRNALPAIQRVEDVAAFVALLSTLPATSGQVFDLGSRVPGAW